MNNKKEHVEERGSSISPSEEKAISEDIQKLTPLNVLKEKHETKKEEIKLSDKREFSEVAKEAVSSIRDYISTYITLADAKAGFILGIAAGLLATTYLNAPKIFKTNLKMWEIIDFLTFAGFLCLGAAIYFSLLVVWPRTLLSKKKGFCSWVHIANYKTTEEYLKDILSANNGKMIEVLYELNYDLSAVCKQKYLGLSKAFRWGLIGVIICTFVLIFGGK